MGPSDPSKKEDDRSAGFKESTDLDVAPVRSDPIKSKLFERQQPIRRNHHRRMASNNCYDILLEDIDHHDKSNNNNNDTNRKSMNRKKKGLVQKSERSSSSFIITALIRPLLRWIPIYLLIVCCNHWPNTTSGFLVQFVGCDQQQQPVSSMFDNQQQHLVNFDVIPSEFDDDNLDNNQLSAIDQFRRQKSLISYLVGSAQSSANNHHHQSEDLLESPTASLSNTQTGSVDSPPATTTSSTNKQETSDSGSSSSSSNLKDATNTIVTQSGNPVTDQLNAVVNLLQQIGSTTIRQQQQQQQQPQQQLASSVPLVNVNAISEAIANGLANNIINPIRSQTAAVGNIVRQTITGNRVPQASNVVSQQQPQPQPQPQQQQQLILQQQQQQPAQQKPPTVGQSIDGNIEFDSNQNAITGFIEWPNFINFNRSSKPSLNTIKPLMLAALKTVPLKLGAVGWKLLQLIAWKKIYKTHHPKSHELEIEEEFKTTSGKDHGDGMMMISKKAKSMGDLTSKKGFSGGGGSSGSGGQVYGWPDGMIDSPGSLMSSGSSVYQRHMLQQQNHNSHPATAAAAAAAATAAAIQSQWLQQQLMAGELDPSTVGLATSSNNSQHNGTSTSSVLNRKRTTRAGSGNWYASPAHAYAAAAANAAATAASSVSRQQHEHQLQNQQQQLYHQRLGLHDPMLQQDPGSVAFQQALAGIMYQNLFDNAAAMAVQNAVKLPQMNEFMEQGSYNQIASSPSHSFLTSSSLDQAAEEQAAAWQASSSSSGISSQLGSSSSNLGQFITRSDSADHSPTLPVYDDRPRQTEVHESSIGSSMQDFDDTPAAHYLDSAVLDRT